MATLTKDDQTRIDNIIEDINLRTGQTYPDVSLLDLAESYGVEVYEADLSSLGSNISGVIEYDDDKAKTNPRIYINSDISDRRKVFTLAHELGHHFLHEGRKFRLDTLDYSAEDKDIKEESEANYFAASILVPQKLLTKKLEERISAQELADYFDVSLPVIQNRIKWIETN